MFNITTNSYIPLISIDIYDIKLLLLSYGDFYWGVIYNGEVVGFALRMPTLLVDEDVSFVLIVKCFLTCRYNFQIKLVLCVCAARSHFGSSCCRSEN